MNTLRALLVLWLLPVSSLSAQDSQGVAGLSERAGFWRVPLHTHEELAEYGLWAADRDFKASFHDGFVFYPVLGRSYPHNLPLRWTTRSVSAGGVPIADLGRSERAHTDSRCEYRYGGVTEAYEVRADGVEQTFTIDERPQAAGDLVVEGRIDTELQPVAGGAEPAHRELLFADASGVPLVRYGKAWAQDARGDTIEITTHLRGKTVELRVPGAWLAGAQFPVTIDPLTSRVTVIGGVTGTYPELTSIHTESLSPAFNTMVAFERVVSATDIDVYGFLTTSDLTGSSLVFTMVNTNYALRPDVTFVVGANRWLLTYEYRTSVSDGPTIYLHDRGDTRLGTGKLRGIAGLGAAPCILPSVAGTLHPTSPFGLLVYESYSNTGASAIWGVPVDCANAVAGTPFRISSPLLDAQEPDVNCEAGADDDGWVVAYTARTGSTDDYDVYVARVGTNPVAAGSTALIGPDVEAGDKAHPVVQGQGGRYLVAMLQDVQARVGRYFGRNLWTERIDWPNAQALPAKKALARRITSSGYTIVNHHLAYDTATRSHWCLVYDHDQGPAVLSVTSRAALLGHDGGPLEDVAIDGGSDRYSPSVVYSASRGAFPIVFCRIEALANGVYGLFLEHAPGAINQLYGTGCGPAYIGAPFLPRAGSEFYAITLNSAPTAQPAALWLSAASATVALDGFGASGCFLNLGPLAAALPFATGSSGFAQLTLALPDDPVVRGDLFAQLVYLWPESPNPLPIGTTRGLRALVR